MAAIEDVLAVYQCPRRRRMPLVCFNEAFVPAEARRLVESFEWHYIPKHGSWLDMAESEPAIVSNQCLDRRIPNQRTLAKETAAWKKYRNKHHAKANWQVTTHDARIKLKYLYPTF